MPKKVILCVDDEPIVLKSLRSQLKEELGDDFYVEMAEEPEEALEILDEYFADHLRILVILSDWLMPGMKGDDFLIAAHKKYPDVVKIILTGQADQKAIDNAFANANLYKCLRKPWNRTELVDTIQSGILEMENAR